ncbi:hypothetical protein NM208_g13015 [Fusarium decemcellulare]|uniref:Uncharacterized protein n=1 Tax=Fusarium decemcellulare TaxID=57161 RepID=A0ACC1RPZ6_9HYPO|nr:hypothetical protein NM208_g13015 [Fusarium decemcellulare]
MSNPTFDVGLRVEGSADRVFKWLLLSITWCGWRMLVAEARRHENFRGAIVDWKSSVYGWPSKSQDRHVRHIIINSAAFEVEYDQFAHLSLGNPLGCMYRPRLLGQSLRGIAHARTSRRTYITDADVESARRYCFTQLQNSDYDAHLIRRFVPAPVQDAYAAFRTLNLELVRLPELVSNPTIGTLRMKFWQDSIDNTFAGRPPREPICILLHKSLQELEDRAGIATKKSIKFWVSRLRAWKTMPKTLIRL